MELENAKAIVRHLRNEVDDDKAYVSEGYSGRGMYGKTTTGVVCSNVDDAVFAMGKLGIEDSRRTDSMGLGVVIY